MATGALRTPLCDLLGIDVPILQAGMGRTRGTPTPPALVVAVCEAGGLGCLGGVGLEPEELRRAIAEIRSGTSRPFAVGLLLPANLAESPPTRDAIRSAVRERFPEHWRLVQSLYAQFGLPQVPMERAGLLSNDYVRAQVEVVLDERVPIFVAGLGDPAWVIRDPRARDMNVIGLAGSVRNALRQRQAGVAAVIAQGYEAGGHTGTIANFALIPQVVDAVVPLPVIGAGAISDGRGVAAALALGAQGAWIGTAFLFALETDLPEPHRQQLAHARSEDLVISRAYTGKTARQLMNETVRAWLASGLEPLPTPYQWVLMDDFVAAAEAAGRFELVNLPAGQGAGMLTERKPARRIVDELVAGTIRELGRLAAMAGAAAAR
jgi:NAD(P)H-dependent flavin oxidoreductase YrpB (nitropropane dioxygenase family)